MITAPDNYFFTCGASEGLTRQNAFIGAKLAAGIGHLSLVETRIQLPPNCQLCLQPELAEGTLCPALTAEIASEIPGEIISAAVAVAWPTETLRAGLVMGYAARGHKEDIEAIVRRMAEEGLGMRGLSVRQIHSIAVQHRVQRIGCAVASLILY